MAILFSIAGLGFACVLTQLALMREMLCAFSGNEMVLGILLGNWLLLTGLGAWLGRAAHRLRAPVTVFVAGQILVSLIPLAQVVAFRAGLRAVFPSGASIGLGGTLAASFGLLLPFCLVSGFLLTLGCSVLATHGSPAAIGRVYLADALGSVLGGALFSVVFALDHFALLGLPAVVNLLLAAWVAHHFQKEILAILPLALAAGTGALLGWGHIDARSTAAQFPGQQVVFRGNSPYGKLVVTQSAGQFNLYQNGVPVASTQDIGEAEETAHYALSQRPGAARVLLVSGGMSGAPREILKHGVRELTCVELDPLVLEAGRRFRPEGWSAPRSRWVSTDGRLLMKQAVQPFDAVILDLPSPASAQVNRFFTTEFFREVKRSLTPDGVLALPLAGYENYVSPELGRLLATTRRTLAESFRHVLVVPGERTFFLASDGPLDLDFAARLEGQRIATRLLSRHYLEAMLAPDRQEQVRQAAAGPGDVNKDFNPVLYYDYLLYWGSQFQSGFGLLAVVLLPALAVGLLRFRPVPLAVFASGFASSALEMVLLLGFQALYGSLYRQLGLLVSLFMAGLAVGALAANRAAPRRGRGGLGLVACALAGFAAVLPGLLEGLARQSGGAALVWAPLVIYLLTFLLALLVGAAFPLASRADRERAAVGSGGPAGGSQGAAATASGLYAADFMGACVGALLVSAVLIPLLGMAAVCWLTALLNLVAAAFLWRSDFARGGSPGS